MKTIALIVLITAALSTTTFAQCDKKLVLTASKTEHLDSKGVVQRTDNEKSIVEIGKTDLTITINDDHVLAGAIKANICNWTMPYKTGKTVIKAVLSQNGDERNVTVTIEGKDGKVTLLFEMEVEPDDRIRIGIDKFEERS